MAEQAAERDSFMRRVLLAIAAFPVVLYLIALAIPIDPVERRPGFRLSGAVEDAPSDWSTVIRPRTKIAVQTSTGYGLPHSVTTVSLAIDGDLYVPCGRCAEKRWPRNVERDPDVVVKVGDVLYERRAVRVEDERLRRRAFRGARGDMSGVWLYRMDPRG